MLLCNQAEGVCLGVISHALPAGSLASHIFCPLSRPGSEQEAVGRPQGLGVPRGLSIERRESFPLDSEASLQDPDILSQTPLASGETG